MNGKGRSTNSVSHLKFNGELVAMRYSALA
jgi:hypothetical protein